MLFLEIKTGNEQDEKVSRKEKVLVYPLPPKKARSAYPLCGNFSRAFNGFVSPNLCGAAPFGVISISVISTAGEWSKLII